MDDPKTELCSHLNFVEIVGPETGRYYGLYRIMPTETSRAIETNRITYELEHVLATLMDDVIDGLLPALINRTTRENLERLLSLQESKHWRLGRVDFERFFQYSFENENGLLAPVLSIPQPFDEPFEFTFDTRSYPWTLNLVRPSDNVQAEIRWGKDMISFDEVSDPSEIVNYIIPKGSGEGVNQLTIADVNEGRTYLKDDASIEKWGKRSYIWIDKRFKHAESLKESAQSLLNQWKSPKISFEVDSTDLSILSEYAMQQRQLNGVTRIIVEDKVYYGRILEEKIGDLAKEFEVDYKIANRLDDVATIQADVERKQAVNDAYSQGATNILAFSYQDNADSNVPALIPFYVDEDVSNINTCELTFRTKPFRAYSRATEGGGAVVKSTKGGGATTESTTSGGATTKSTTSGGGSQRTSSSGGGVSKSTESGGSTTESSSAGGDHRHVMFTGSTAQGPVNYRMYEAAHGGLVRMEASSDTLTTAGASGSHTHSISIPAHSHSFSTPNHTHSVDIPAHTHDVTIPNHSHEVSIPDHTHEIELPDHIHDVKHEIIELDGTPSKVEIRVDGTIVEFTGTEGDRFDLIPHLEKNESGKVNRGRHEVELIPNGLARVEADLILRVFVQSQLGGVY